MKNRRMYIKAGLDMRRIDSIADQSRAKHLGDLMDEQEALAQEDYNQSTSRYQKSQVYKFESDFEDTVTSKLLDINRTVQSVIKKYNLDGCDLWVDIANSLGTGGWSRGDGLKFRAVDDSGWIDVELGLDNMLPIMSYAVVESDDPDDYGNPDAAWLTLDYFNAKNFCNVIYDVYVSRYGTPDFDSIYEMGEELLDFIVDDFIANDVTNAIESCLQNNPPPLG